MNLIKEVQATTRAGLIAPIAQAVAARDVSATELVTSAFERIGEIDGSLHAFCTLDERGALEAAARVDQRITRGDEVGPLAGVPVAIKDLISTRGLATSYGSRLYEDFVPDEDDVVVERLKASGAIVVGKTNTSEFGYGAVGHNDLFPTTRNPWDVRLTSGGSSAGSAVAVAAGMVPVAIGSDGGGSIRIPASLCGVFGIKPSWGRVPVYPGCRDERFPGISSWESLEHIGPLTRYVADAAAILSAVVGPTPNDRASLPRDIESWDIPGHESLRGARIALSIDMGFAPVDPEVAVAVQTAGENLQRAVGCRIDRAQPEVGDMHETFDALVALDTDRTGLLRMAQEKNIAFRGWLDRLLKHRWTAQEFTDAQLQRKRIVNSTARFMRNYDFLLTPTVGCPAFEIDREGPSHIGGTEVPSHAWLPFSPLGNFTGLPTASIPIGLTQAGLPIAIQVMGRHLDDIGVLGLSAVLEALHPMSSPPVSVRKNWIAGSATA